MHFDPFQSTGEVRNACCECPVGKGPTATCKHIVAILLQLFKFGKGEDISVLKSCTEELQTFHKPRKFHSGSPVKAKDLSKKRIVYNSINRVYPEHVLFFSIFPTMED